ncbi:MAG: NUDIX domain-containing protein [Gordonia sp. (in: high G+C Gram-positive bacteria)]
MSNRTHPRSAGLLVFRRAAGPSGGIELLLAHPGGPLWARKDDGAWSIPKGLVESGEDDATAARREFAEEIGQPAPDGELIDLGEVRLAGGKRVVAFGVAGDLDVGVVESTTFEMVWPPRSGRRQSFPEIDRADWFSPAEAVRKLNPAQGVFIARLVAVAGQP